MKRPDRRFTVLMVKTLDIVTTALNGKAVLLERTLTFGYLIAANNKAIGVQLEKVPFMH